MHATRPKIQIPCDCGEYAQLKHINDYPFTKGFTEATYECAACGTAMKRATQVTGHIWREEAPVG
jgi:hypothetical protein